QKYELVFNITDQTLNDVSDCFIRFQAKDTPDFPFTITHASLQIGSVAYDWCPNPAEILTQSDYAKIKAAIVALGGSLS
ncbi:collagen-like protein, partial [Lactiplantibacillus plantarum]|nr:collagen-like protein [Lactiplantibacillus plantarum]